MNHDPGAQSAGQFLLHLIRHPVGRDQIKPGRYLYVQGDLPVEPVVMYLDPMYTPVRVQKNLAP